MFNAPQIFASPEWPTPDKLAAKITKKLGWDHKLFVCTIYRQQNEH
jgi:hypothetical protein